MPFAEAAAYFKRRASKAREGGSEQRRLEEAAEFYQTLAAITPDFPQGYKMPRMNSYSRWEARAEVCRTMAECIPDPLCRAEMLQVAESYEQLSKSSQLARPPSLCRELGRRNFSRLIR